MARFRIPNSSGFHTIRSFLAQERIFAPDQGEATLEFNPSWAHMEPVTLAMIAAWGGWCRRTGRRIFVKNLGHKGEYAARMHLFEHLGVEFDPAQREREEAGRFLPITQVRTRDEIGPVIGDVSALLHLQDDAESLAAVQYCVSELLRNVLEHSGSDEGAYVCAHRYTNCAVERVTIAVADCGAGIQEHLGRAHPEALASDRVALALAMRPGITGAIPGLYGTPDNAGAGLYITRSIAKGTGGYFLLASGRAGFRQRRSTQEQQQMILYLDSLDDPRHDMWRFRAPWQGTVAALEIRTEHIGDYEGFFQWIFRQIPDRTKQPHGIRFT